MSGIIHRGDTIGLRSPGVKVGKSVLRCVETAEKEVQDISCWGSGGVPQLNISPKRACCTNPFPKIRNIGKIELVIEGGGDGIQLNRMQQGADISDAGESAGLVTGGTPGVVHS